MFYKDLIQELTELKSKVMVQNVNIQAESAARMRLQNQFQSRLDIARYTAAIMRKDMEEYDSNPEAYTQSFRMLAWFYRSAKTYLYKKTFWNYGQKVSLSIRMDGCGFEIRIWPSLTRSVHVRKKTTVASLINELYTFLKQADARELGDLFRQLDSLEGKEKEEVQKKIDNFQTHIVPIIADIDAGFGNEEATYLMAKQMIEAGACCILDREPGLR